MTVARALSDTYAGIAAAGVPAFIVAQLAGACAAVGLAQWLWPLAKPTTAATNGDLSGACPRHFDRACEIPRVSQQTRGGRFC